ncbi:MAG: isocitrate lyase/phosphoenolpyruvate mutase family protein [Bryobacterales bacterium]|nr:isocitrate lyase/phosphoenolpyruvate mutase family protein [Bryobacterales bacterium]
MGNLNFRERRNAFRRLHESGCFVIPNPWDAGTARLLERLGFQALASTSSGFAFSLGLPDSEGAVPVAAVLAHLQDLVAATNLPVNADFESGYAAELEPLAENVRLCVEAGVAGLSIEDSTGDRTHPLYDLPRAIERVRTARKAIDGTQTGVLLVARAECFLTQHADALREAVKRLEAYATEGADVLYAPGLRTIDEIRTVVNAVAPKPVNVLMSSDSGLRVGDLAEAGVRRISVGSGLARAAWAGFLKTAREIAEHGTFSGFAGITSFGELNGFFHERLNNQRAGG